MRCPALAVAFVLLMLWAGAGAGAEPPAEEETPTPVGTVINTPDGKQMRIFSLAHRPALATLEAVRAVLTPAGTVLPDTRTNRLIVKDVPESMERVQKLLEAIDLPAPMVNISLQSNVSLPVSGNRGLVSFQRQNNSNSKQFLVVMSGEKAHIEIGRELVYVDPYVSYLARLGLAPSGLAVQLVSTGFAVAPQVLGQDIVLVITPYITIGRDPIDVIQASSTVRLRRGESVTLASLQGDSQREAYGLILGGSSLHQSSNVELTLSADVMEEP